MYETAILDDVRALSVEPLSDAELLLVDGGTEDPISGDPSRWCLSCILGRCGRGPIPRSDEVVY